MMQGKKGYSLDISLPDSGFIVCILRFPDFFDPFIATQ